ncbi:2-succinylbenzoate--CoA ligase [Roseofilum casamattae]|uniref:2-succinylbenzoate--CoA ligase n=1 Tax=Roseofilum casamattae BLCC-M143 TaxID=3022442 RepID=A0ABT7C3R9_9CYAN|nr:2-succinylbenzoate--CoA ligase [Roseofilum casamattae]MDJ1185464.1 2-succinylbenzoate--CoA ligase [Roseofilum casamattae BLCC-M143]
MAIELSVDSLQAIAPHSDRLYPLFRQKQQELLQYAVPPRILLNYSEPIAFLASFFAAVATESPVFLGNPHWTTAQWETVCELIQPELIWGTIPCSAIPGSPPPPFPGTIMIPTGGSSSTIRFAMHTWETLSASVRGFVSHFDRTPVNCCCTLPLYHVSGLMQAIRVLLTGGTLAIFPYYSIPLSYGKDPRNYPQKYFLSLVPTQLKRLLDRKTPVLSQFYAVLLGGGPAWPELLQQARAAGVPVALTYGMTETASQVATLHPQEFLQGNTSCGRTLPHARIIVTDEKGKSLPRGKTGRLAIAAESLALGYFPEPFSPNAQLLSDDIGYFDKEANLHILGRHSQTIVTGGEKVFPQEVESAIAGTQLVKDVAVIGVRDPDWGEMVVAFYVPVRRRITVEELQAAIAPHLSRYKQPKRWIALSQLPRSPHGKLDKRYLLLMTE